MENDKQTILDKLYEIIDTVERLESAVDNVYDMVVEKLGSSGYACDQVLENLSIVDDGIAMCITGTDRAISRMKRLL